MAFWYVKEKNIGGSAFGHNEKFTGLGIFIDTYKNGDSNNAYPLIYGMVNDGTVSYDQDKDGGDSGMLNNCYAGLRNKNHDSHLRIYYNYEEKYLEVGIDVDQNDKFHKFLKSEVAELSNNHKKNDEIFRNNLKNHSNTTRILNF